MTRFCRASSRSTINDQSTIKQDEPFTSSSKGKMAEELNDEDQMVLDAFWEFAHDLRKLSSAGRHTCGTIAALQGIPVLLSLLADENATAGNGGSSDPRWDAMADDALVSLITLSSDHDAVSEVIELGGLDILANRLSTTRSKSSSSTVGHTLDLLLQIIESPLMTDDLRVRLVDMGALDALVILIRSQDDSIALPAGQVLLALAIDRNLHCYRRMGQGVIEPVLIVCEAHFTDEFIDCGTAVLLKMMEPAQEGLYLHLEGPDALLRILSHCTRPAALAHTTSLLLELSRNAAIRRKIIECGGLSPLTIIQQNGAASRQLQETAAFLLAQLSIQEGLAFEK